MRQAKNPQSRLIQRLENITLSILTKIILKAHPDFDDKIKDVHECMLELDVDSELPGREIGLNEKGNATMIMP